MAPLTRSTQPPGLCGWGRTHLPGAEIRGENLARLSEGRPLSRGLGRSYGDASLLASPDAVAVNTTLADRLLSFDESTGLLRAEAGLCLAELNRLFLPRLWFTPVTPGTKFVTLGGMVASDVHGKNHHVSGTFGRHVESLLVRTGRGVVVECSRTEHPDLFFATLGGMGLTDQDFGALTALLWRESSGIGCRKLGLVLEGGYDLSALERSGNAVAEALLGATFELDPSLPGVRAQQAIDETRRALSAHWEL